MKKWPIKPLGDLLRIQNGFAFDSARFNDTKQGIPIIRIRDLARSCTETFYDGEHDASYEVNNGDLLIGMDGEFRCYRWQGGKALLNQRVCRLQHFDAALNSSYVFYGINRHLSQIESNTSFVTVKHLSSKQIAQINMPVPPVVEQERIVKLLDGADELRTLRAQSDRRTAALIPALFHEMFGDPGTNSRGLPMKPFGELVSNQDGRRKPVKASDRAERQGEYPYYGASGIIDYVEKYLFDETALLIGEDGANLLARSTPIAFLAHGKYWVNNHAHVVTENGKADLNYLCTALNLRDLTDFVTGSAQPKLNQANMNRIPIPVPPLSLQKDLEVDP
jgi:type I restriction enzyme S subunit